MRSVSIMLFHNIQVTTEDSSRPLFSQTFLFVDPFWFQKIMKDPYILVQLNIEHPDERYPKLKMCTSNDFIYPRKHTSSINNNALYDLSLTKLTVAHF